MATMTLFLTFCFIGIVAAIIGRFAFLAKRDGFRYTLRELFDCYPEIVLTFSVSVFWLAAAFLTRGGA